MATSNAERVSAEVFDPSLLRDYSAQDQALAVEILELFLVQMPTIIDALESASSQTAWTFATHTLKGSAASIGARKLQALAAELEAMAFREGDTLRLLRLQSVRAAASDFRRAAREAFPGPG